MPAGCIHLHTFKEKVKEDLLLETGGEVLDARVVEEQKAYRKFPSAVSTTVPTLQPHSDGFETASTMSLP